MMFFFMRRAFNRAVYRLYEHVWVVVFGMISALYLSGLCVMRAAGEQVVVDNYSWWFIVTITTVGYGDFSPVTSVGRIMASIIMLVGIGIIGLVIGKLAEFVIDLANKKAKGMGSMKHINHTVIMGYRNGGTEKLIEELLANHADEVIVLCSQDLEKNPNIDDDVDFIRGDLASEDVLNRANVAEARHVVIHRDNDDRTFFTAYAVREINKRAHVICFLADEQHSSKIRSLPAEDPTLNQVVLPVHNYLIAQELQDRESSAVFHHLMSNLTGHTLYRMDIPSDFGIECEFQDLFIGMKRQFGATAVAVKGAELVSNPPLDMPIKAGIAIFYTSSSRISADKLLELF